MTTSHQEHQHPKPERIRELAAVEDRFYTDEEQKEALAIAACPRCQPIFTSAVSEEPGISRV